MQTSNTNCTVGLQKTEYSAKVMNKININRDKKGFIKESIYVIVSMLKMM